MSKGIIVIEIPENCRMCPLRTESATCIASRKDVYIFALRYEKPDWCPIKPMPEQNERQKDGG